MFYKVHHSRLLATFFISVAIIVGCASESAQKTAEKKNSQPSSTLPSISQNPSVTAVEQTAPTDAAGVVAETTPDNSAVTSKIETQDDSDQYVNGKKLSIPKITGSVPPRDDSYHDTHNDAIVVLQSPTEAMAKFPRDRREEVDWVKTLDQGLIDPRVNLKGGDEMVTMDLDIIMKNTQFMPWVRFPHLQHTKWLACQNCHPAIFIPQENANPISMNKVLRGEYCGVCHDKVSFSLFICERCHSIPHEGSGPAWWK